MTTRNWCDRSWDEVAAYLGERGDQACAVVPVGAIEAHGRHAPLGTDNAIAGGVAARLAEQVDALVAPGIPFGPLHTDYELDYFPGSLTIQPETLVALAGDVGRALGSQGFDPVVFVNAHGPNTHALALAAPAIHAASGAQVGVLEWWAAAREEIVAIKGFAYGNHADEIETSLLLAADPAARVDLSRAVRNDPRLGELSEAERAVYLAKTPFTHRFDERWVGTSGNMGDPAAATADKGERIVAATVALGVQLIQALREQRGLARGRADGNGTGQQ